MMMDPRNRVGRRTVAGFAFADGADNQVHGRRRRRGLGRRLGRGLRFGSHAVDLGSTRHAAVARRPAPGAVYSSPQRSQTLVKLVMGMGLASLQRYPNAIATLMQHVSWAPLDAIKRLGIIV